MIGWHHQHNGHKSEQIPGHSEGQGNKLPSMGFSGKELGMTEQG